MAKNPQKKFVTKKHIARLERERMHNRYIIIVSGIILLIVAVMVGYGFVENYIIRPKQPIAIVNDDEISTHEFQLNVRFYRQQLINQYLQTKQFMELLGGDQANQGYFDQNLQAIRLQLESATLGQNILDQLIEDRIIRQEAQRNGIIVTDEDIDKAMQADFNYYPGGTPTPTSTQRAISTSTLSPTQLALISPTPTEVITPTSQPEFTITPALELTPTATLASTLTPTPYTEDAYLENYQSYLDYLTSELDISEADIRYIYESRLYYEKVYDILTADLAEEQEQVWARHILVEDEATAQELYERLINGEDFSALAAEYSEDSSNAANGGDLGWFGLGMMEPEFEKIAFNLNIGQLSEPFQTSFGWHIVQVLGKETRPLSTTDYQQLQESKYNSWLDNQRNEGEIKIFDYWAERVPLIPTLPPNV
jgi:peptidyl-prolyl cis-trans isomerase D